MKKIVKRYYRLFLALLITASFLLIACQGESSGNNTADMTQEGGFCIYYTNTEEDSLQRMEYERTETGDAAVAELFDVLRNGQYNDGRPAVPADVELDRNAWQENSLILYLSGSYPEVGTVQEILCRSALVCTLCQLEEVSGVTIYVNNQPLENTNGEEIGIMTSEKFLADITAGTEDTAVKATIYFANKTGDALVPQTVTLNRSSEQSLEQQVVDLLIAGPGMNEDCIASIPAGTKVISVTVKNQICYVNLDSSFTADNLALKEYIPVYAFVNSLTGLGEVDSVQLMIDGSVDVTFGENISFAVPLTAKSDYIE